MVIEETGMAGLPDFKHGMFPQILSSAGFTQITVENITERMTPMLKRFYQIAFLPYQIIKLLKLERKFINTTTAGEFYPNLVKNADCWRYNIITAVKSN